MKKFKLIFLIPLFILLAACSASPKDTFKQRMESASNKDKAGYQFTVKVNKFEVSDPAVSSELGLGDLSKAKLSFDIHQSLKDAKMSISADLSALNEDWSDISVIYDDDKAYMSLEAIVAFMGQDTSNFKGKYIDLSEYPDAEIPSLSTSREKADLSWINDIDDDKFTEKDGTVTGTFTLNELFDVVTKTLEDDEETETYLNLALASFSKKSTVKISYDKNGNGRILMKLAFAAGVDVGIKEIELEMKFKEIDYVEPKVPAKKNIVSVDEVQSLIASSYKFTDSDFQELYDNISGSSKEEIETMLEFYSAYLTDEQKAKIEELLKTKA